MTKTPFREESGKANSLKTLKNLQQRIFQPSRLRGEILLILCVVVVSYLLSSQFEFLERFAAFSRSHEDWELDEFLIVSLSLMLVFGGILIGRWRDLVKAQRFLDQRNQELETALSEIKQLQGILPICISCKKIRDDEGFWQQVEVYIRDRSDAEFSHGICPECAKRHYGDFLPKTESGGTSDQAGHPS